MPPKKSKTNSGRFNIGQYMSKLSEKRIETINRSKKVQTLTEKSKKLEKIWSAPKCNPKP